jgi:hypothetical protein
MTPVKAAQYASGVPAPGVNFKALEKETQRKIWETLVLKVESNSEQVLCSDWMPFFSDILGLFLSVLKQLQLDLRVNLLHNFTQIMFSDIDYERLADLGREEVEEIRGRLGVQKRGAERQRTAAHRRRGAESRGHHLEVEHRLQIDSGGRGRPGKEESTDSVFSQLLRFQRNKQDT